MNAYKTNEQMKFGVRIIEAKRSTNNTNSAKQTVLTEQTNTRDFSNSNQGEKALGKHCTYLDCLRGRAPIPHNTNGDALFQVMMTGGMVAFMTTVNGLRNTGLEFLESSLWLYPLIFCIALLLRISTTSKIVHALKPRLIDKYFSGTAHALAMTVLNTCVTAPIMCGLTTLLLMGPENFAVNYFATLPITAPISIFVSYFIVGPIVKMVFNNRISPAQGVHILEEINEDGATIARMMGLS